MVVVVVVSLNLSLNIQHFDLPCSVTCPICPASLFSVMALPTTVASVNFMTPIKMDAMLFPPKVSESRQSRSLGYLNQNDSRLKDILINM